MLRSCLRGTAYPRRPFRPVGPKISAWILVGLILAGPPGQVAGDELPQSRRSPLVDLVAQVEPAVVALFCTNDQGQMLGSGSGVIIHRDGFALTNDHVLKTPQGIALVAGRPLRYAVVGRLPEKDLAIVQVLGLSGPAATAPLGHSHDVRTGETIAAFGNPGGRGTIVTSGIVSARRLVLSFPNAMVPFYYPHSRRDDFIQFDAAVNMGNSGGPLVNMDGEIIGVVARLLADEQNASFAIPVDRFRELIVPIVEAELVHDRIVGLTVQPQSDQAIVVSVATDSPADVAGFRRGDLLESINDAAITHAVDYQLALWGRLASHEPLQIIVRRDGAVIPFRVQPQRPEPIPAQPQAGDRDGVRYEWIEGEFQSLPDFTRHAVVGTGVLAKPSLPEKDCPDRNFAMRLTGYLQIPDDGLYRLTLNSDDGSRMFWHDERIIDHDGTHPSTDATVRLRATKGWHPIRIEYFESTGEQTLSLRLQSLNELGENGDEIEPRYRCDG